MDNDRGIPETEIKSLILFPKIFGDGKVAWDYYNHPNLMLEKSIKGKT